MNQRNLTRPVGAIVLVCAVSALTFVPPAAAGEDLPGQELGELQRPVGQAVSEASALTKSPTTPVAGGPSRLAPKSSTPGPATHRSSPAPAARHSNPSPLAARSAPAQPVSPAGRVRATISQDGDSSGQASPQSSSRAAARTPGSLGQADPTDAAEATTPAETGDFGDEDAETLPFTGSSTLPLLLMAVLALLAGISLRRAVRGPV